jgi:hypothetical protein
MSIIQVLLGGSSEDPQPSNSDGESEASWESVLGGKEAGGELKSFFTKLL